MSDWSLPASPSGYSSPRSGFQSDLDHSMEGSYSSKESRSSRFSSPAHLPASYSPASSPKVVTVDDEEKLSPEEDPGPGDVLVQVSDSSTIHVMDKRALALKSEYFRSYLIRFHAKNMDMQEEKERTVELNSDFVSSEAWAVIKIFVESGELVLQDEVAFEVLQASNYLQMDKVQDATVEYLKKLVSKTNFLTVYDFAVLRGITNLSNYITSTIIKPAEVVRRRKYGAFDLNLKLGQLVFKCHWSVLSSMSLRIKTVLGEKEVDKVVDSSSFGITCENSQLFYNVFELVYLGREELSIYSFEEGISVFKILHSLKFDCKFIQSCLTELSRLVSMSNYQELYTVGSELSHEGLSNIALYFMMYKIEQLKATEFFFGLPCEDCCKILSHSMLNVPSEFSVVEIILNWLKSKEMNTPMVQIEGMAMEMLRCVRWAKISQAETEFMMKKDFVLKSKNIQTFLRSQLESSAENSEDRGWPKMLVLVERPTSNSFYKGRDINSLSEMCSVQSYDSETKQWSTLSQIPAKWNNEVMGYSVTNVQNNLVLTWTNNSVPYIPIAVQTYDIWANSWSKNPCLAAANKSLNLEGHSTVEVKDKLYTVLVPRTKPMTGTLCLHIMSGLLTDSPLWSVASQPSPQTEGDIPDLTVTGDLVHVIGYREAPGRISLHTYNTTTQEWSEEWLRTNDKVLISGWVGWDGGIVRAGGLCRESETSSDKCTIFPLQGGEGKSLANMVKPRVGPGLVVYEGMLFAAGGYNQNRLVSKVKDSEKKKRKKKAKTEIVVEDSVEYYVPQLDSWNLMRTQPKLSCGSVSLMVMDKPIRLMSKGNVRFKVNRGVKSQPTKKNLVNCDLY